MKMDIESNYTLTEGLTAAERTADTYYTASVDHASGNCAAFFVSLGTYATSFVATVQYSDDDSSFTDEDDTTYGNEVSLTLTAAGSGTLNVPNPRARYSRVKVVVGGTNTFSVTNILGPKRFIDA